MTVFVVPDDGSGGAPGPAGQVGISGSLAESRGEIYTGGGSIAVALTGAAGYEKLPVFTTNNPTNNSDVTPDAANDRLVVHREGVYEIYWQLSAFSSFFGTFFLRPFSSGAPVLGVDGGCLLITTAFPAAAFAVGEAYLARSSFLELYGDAPANLTITVTDATLQARRIRD